MGLSPADPQPDDGLDEHRRRTGCVLEADEHHERSCVILRTAEATNANATNDDTKGSDR